MRTWPIILAVLAAIPTAACAGAWPRDAGEVFLSFSYSAGGDPAAIGTAGFPASDYTALYLEYGVTDRLTFGLDAGRGGDGTSTAFAFLRRALSPADAPTQFALGLGAGRYAPAGGPTEPLAVATGAIGRGFETRFGPGWANADLSLHWRAQTGDTVAKADFTLGLKPRPGRLLILQLQTGAYPGSDPYARLAPSLVQRVAPGIYLETGAEIGLAGGDHVGLKIGTWLEF